MNLLRNARDYLCKKSIWFRRTYNSIWPVMELKYNANDSKPKKRILLILNLIAIFTRKILKKMTGKLETAYMEFVITTKCTLKCKDCANLLQHYKNPYNICIEELKKHFDKLMDVFDYIHILSVIGGEPFMHPQISELIAYICQSNKIGAVRITTNGTLIPGKKTLDALKNPKITVKLSNYGKYSSKLEALKNILSENNIKYHVMNLDYWFDYGGTEARNRGAHELQDIFSDCRTPLCQSYLNGEFHFCPRSSAGVDLGLVPKKESDYVNIGKLETKEARKQMKKFLSKTKFVQACDYCDNSYRLPLARIKPGIQKTIKISI